MDKLLNVKETALALGISPGLVRRIYKQGLITGLLIGRGIKFRETTIDKFLKDFDGKNINQMLNKEEA